MSQTLVLSKQSTICLLQRVLALKFEIKTSANLRNENHPVQVQQLQAVPCLQPTGDTLRSSCDTVSVSGRVECHSALYCSSHKTADCVDVSDVLPSETADLCVLSDVQTETADVYVLSDVVTKTTAD